MRGKEWAYCLQVVCWGWMGGGGERCLEWYNRKRPRASDIGIIALLAEGSVGPAQKRQGARGGREGAALASMVRGYLVWVRFLLEALVGLGSSG